MNMILPIDMKVNRMEAPMPGDNNGTEVGGFSRELEKATESNEASKKPIVGKKADTEDNVMLPEEELSAEIDESTAEETMVVPGVILIPVLVADVAVVTADVGVAPVTGEVAVESLAILPQVMAGDKNLDMQMQPEQKAAVQPVLTEEVLNSDPVTDQKADVPKTPTANVVVSTDGNEAQFVQDAIKELDVMLGKQPAQNTAQEDKAGLDMERTAESGEAGIVKTMKAESDQGDRAGTQPENKKTSTQIPQTANVTPEGKVEFKAAQAAIPMEEMPAPVKETLTSIIDQVKTAVTKEKSELYIQLKPAHLGGLVISLVMGEKGVTAKLFTSQQEVQNMLNHDITQVQEALRDKGIQVVQMEVIYDQMANMAGGQKESGRGQGWRSFSGKHEVMDDMEMTGTTFYDNMSNYEVLAEQGGSVEFSA